MMRHCTLFRRRLVGNLPVQPCITALPRLQFSSAHAATAVIATSAGKNGGKHTSIVNALAKYAQGPFNKSFVQRIAQGISDKASADSSFDLYSFLYTKLGESLPPGDGLRQVICDTKRTEAQRDQFAACLQSDVLSVGWSVLDHAADRQHQFCGVSVLRDTDRLTDRHIETDIVKRKVCNEIRKDMTKVLPIVAGESGSGKTVAAILAGGGRDGTGVVVYVHASALPADATFRKKTTSGTSQRNAAVIDALETAVQSAMRGGQWPSKPCPASVTVVCDELGEYPDFLRGLCASRTAVRISLRKKLMVHQVSIIAVGTGTEAVNDAVGSSPSTYNVHLVGEGDVWRDLPRTAVGRKFKLALRHSRSASAVMLRDVVGNARAAAVLARVWQEVKSIFKPLSGPSVDRVCEAMFPGFLLRVVLCFKDLNRLKHLNETQAVDAAMEAVQVVLSQSSPAVPARWKLMTRYGIVTDRAALLQARDIPKGWVRVPGAAAVTEGRKKFHLAAPTAGRYRMTPAQVAFVRLRYGMGPQPVTGEGFERLFQDYLILVTQASIAAAVTHRTTADGAMSTLKGRHGTGGWTSMHAIRALLDVTGATGVAELDAVCKMQPALFDVKKSAGKKMPRWKRFRSWAARVKKLLRAKKCIIAANSPKAESFDAVWLKRHMVIIFRFKRYVNSVLQSYALAAELHKLGCRHWTCCLGSRVKNVSPGDVGTLFGARYAALVNLKQTHVQREKLFRALLQDTSRSRAPDAPCAMAGCLQDLVSTKATKARTSRVVVVAGKRPTNIPSQMIGLATFVHIPSAKFEDALFPLTIPRSSVSSGGAPAEIVWS